MPDCGMSSSLVSFLSSSLIGHAKTGMVITLSMAERNGNEAHQSLEYGLNISLLKNLQGPEKSIEFDSYKLQAEKEYKAAKKGLDECQILKYISIRKCLVDKWD
jgi:hypothetical protein